MAGLLDALDVRRTHLLGLSMGSMIGMEFALRHPDRLDRLVLAGPAAGPARSVIDPISTWNWVKANDQGGEVFGGQQFTWLFSSTFLRNQQAVQETAALLASNPNPIGPEAYERQARAYLQFDASDRLGRIKAPTLVIVGEQDLLTPPWVAREVADGIPGARFEFAPATVHHTCYHWSARTTSTSWWWTSWPSDDEDSRRQCSPRKPYVLRDTRPEVPGRLAFGACGPGPFPEDPPAIMPGVDSLNATVIGWPECSSGTPAARPTHRTSPPSATR
ncbi:MAG: alpha/beta fold hydrolase [Streptosporangiales bacterium]|nr:alpha/beta fold hydrolase [Streptosporangiales bacterium]